MTAAKAVHRPPNRGNSSPDAGRASWLSWWTQTRLRSFATRLLPVDAFYDCDSPFVRPHGKKKMYYWRSICVFVGQAIHYVWARHQEG